MWLVEFRENCARIGNKLYLTCPSRDLPSRLRRVVPEAKFRYMYFNRTFNSLHTRIGTSTYSILNDYIWPLCLRPFVLPILILWEALPAMVPSRICLKSFQINTLARVRGWYRFGNCGIVHFHTLAHALRIVAVNFLQWPHPATMALGWDMFLESTPVLVNSP